ncbi:MAG: ATP synthase subunit I [Eubacteriales bacterium]|nr:ATP synthase subunit I [Eubacteriales bacterium]MDD3072936.1 ATP synthase subunit I [Eubacteriales bacterium]MDD4078157.1 ATP synthase subunit I [Eubacteriales bacterium]MDD4768444.1 ATP synthase subunit I [Eubacteriales bacterium]
MDFSSKIRQISLRTASIALILAGLAALSGRWPAALGVLMGCLISLLNFRLLAQSISRLLDLTPLGARKQAVGRYIIRYILMVLALLMINANPNINVWAALVGLMLIKAVIVGEAALTFTRQKIQGWLNSARWERSGN